jgi:hypothetical protein
MTALERLRQHADELAEETGLTIELVDGGGQIFVILNKVPLPDGAYRITASDVLFIADQQYPVSAMDMFWTEVDVLRADGSVPGGAESIEPYANREWRRFSWHRNGVWRTTGNCLLDHFEFMQARFVQDVPR